MDNTFVFINELSSASPSPGGGGASALIGAVGAALCSMVANLTSGKKKYAEYQGDIERIITKTEDATTNLLSLIEKDAEAFAPLAEAYGIPKDSPDRENILEMALVGACSVPFQILGEIGGLIGIMEELRVKGSRLALSDVGVAAAACRAAAEGAAMNIYINTKLMRDKESADKINRDATLILEDLTGSCEKIYSGILDELRCG